MGKIVAIVTMNNEKVGGGAPIFYEVNQEGLQQTALMLEKIMDASAHDLKNGTLILVNRQFT